MGSCDPYVKMVKTERVEHWEKPAVKSAAKKAPRYYPAEDVKGKLGNHHNTRKQTKLRKSISAGTVVIMLAGHFKGKRVVVLKQLESGLPCDRSLQAERRAASSCAPVLRYRNHHTSGCVKSVN